MQNLSLFLSLSLCVSLTLCFSLSSCVPPIISQSAVSISTLILPLIFTCSVTHLFLSVLLSLHIPYICLPLIAVNMSGPALI